MKSDSAAPPLARRGLHCATLPMMTGMHVQDLPRFSSQHSAIGKAGTAARPWTRLCTLALGGLLLAHQPAADAQDGEPAPLHCPADQPLSLACLQQQAQVLERSMQALYLHLQRRLPQDRAQALQTEQQEWTQERDRRCQPNGYVHEAEDMAACRIGMALSRVVVFKNQWHPLARNAQGGEQP